jgi:hypothetical protein
MQAMSAQAIATSVAWVSFPQGERSEPGAEEGRLRWRDMVLGRLGQRTRR